MFACSTKEERNDLALLHNVMLEASFKGPEVVRAGRMIDALARTVHAFDEGTQRSGGAVLTSTTFVQPAEAPTP